MRNTFRFFVSLLIFCAVTGTAKAQITAAGDIAFSGYTSVTTDEFSFVLLKPCSPGTVIHFTDRGWTGAPTNAFNAASVEETVDWTSPASILPAGTEIKISGLVATNSGGGAAGTVAGTALSLSTGGDQVLAYLGTVGAPTFLSGIHMNVYAIANGDPVNTTAASWDLGNENNGNASALPPGLTTGVNAIWIGTQGNNTTEMDNGIFNCAAAGINITTEAGTRAALNDQTKWTTNNSNPAGFAPPAGCNFMGALSGPAPTINTNPSPSTICVGSNTSFTITATNATSYQWQVDNGGGYVNLSNDATYSNVTTATLNITAAPIGLNGYNYRCVATNGNGSTNSNGALLTVNALPNSPTLLAKTPAAANVADGTPVSATFNAGSGGTGCSDDYRYTTDGGLTYLPYTPGSNISTTGLAAGTGMVFIEGRRANCSSSCQGTYTVLASWAVTPLPAGATTLNAGDIAFTSYTSQTAADDFSFVLLKNIGPGTTINFTDNGYQSGALTNVEQTITWTSNASYVAGTEIKISGLTATLTSGSSAGTVTGTGLSLSTSGDQILAYRGTAASPTFISAIHMNVYSVANGDPVTTTAAAWDGAATGQNASALPPGLTTGVNAIWIGTQDVPASEFDNAAYGTCAGPGTLGPIVGLRAALNNQANWVKDNLAVPGFVIPTGCPYLGAGITPPTINTPPVNATVCAGSVATFTATVTGATSYQWQVDNGGGFANLSDNATYSGSTTSTLTINNTTVGLNGFNYRIIATNGGGSTTSASATLTVNAVPVGPTLLAKTPATATVADGTPVSATFNAGSGGTGCSDDFRYTTDGGATFLPYTPGSNISTTGLAAGTGMVFIEGRRANCSSGCQGAYVVLASWGVSPLPAAPTTLNAGDIAFSGYTSTVTDEFSFVLLKNIGPGTTINFTDNGYQAGALTNVESTVTWTSPAVALPAGTEIKISGLTATRSGPGAAGTVTGTALSLSTSGDQVLAYRGTAASPTFISGIHMNVYSIANGDPSTTTAAAWDGAGTGQNASALPPGLTTGLNAIWIGTQDVPSSEFDNAKFGVCLHPSVPGDIAMLRAALNNQANWTRDNGVPPGFTLPTGCNYLSALCTDLITLTSAPGTDNQTVCINSPITNITYSTTGATGANFSGLPAGVTGVWAANVITISGTPSASGTFNYTVTPTGGCGAPINGTINVSANNTLTLSSAPGTDAQTVCINAPLVNITYNTTGATGASFAGLPSGVTGNWAANVVTISGAPTTTAGSPFNYTVTLTGGCGTTTANGTITVTPNNTISLSSAPGTNAQTVCVNTAITNITYATTGATGATFAGLPAGVTGVWAANVVTISGTPTTAVGSPFNYTVTLTGGCGTITANGTITVTPANTFTLTSAAGTDNQSVCINAPITNITYSTTGATGATFSGLPAGVNGVWAANVVTISGTPTASGTFNYTVTSAGGCGPVTANGTITVNPTPDVTPTPSSQSICSGVIISPILMSGSVGGTAFNWTRDQVGIIGGSIPPNGSGNITGNLVNNTGSPVTVTFTITPTANGCNGTPVTATVTVNPLPLAVINGAGTTVHCAGSNPVISATPDPNYTYAWGRSLFTNPFTPIGTAQTQVITASGNYLLTVTNQYGCFDTAMNTVLVADYEFNGSLAAGDAVQTGRMNRFATISTCAAPKGCPGIFTSTGSRLYDSYTITNPRNVPVCATIGITSFCGTNIFCAAYLGSYNPTNQCTNYLADPGSSFTLSGFYEATIPANGTIVVVVHEVNPSTGCANYKLTVDIPRETPGITVTPSNTICSGGTATLTASTANSYLWAPGGQTTQSINTSVGGTFGVTLGYGNHSCTTTPPSQTITITNPVANAVGNQFFCNGANATVAFTGTNTTGFTWTNSNPAIGLPASGSGDLNFVATNATAGPITGTITVTPTNGACTGTPITFTITVAYTPQILSVTNGSVCSPGGVVNLAATSNGTVNWYDAPVGGNFLNTGNTYSPTISANTTYYVEPVVNVPAPPSLLAMPAQTSTFPGNIRGYWFTAPTDFVITSLMVPTTASSGPQNMAILKFNGNVPPPVFSATTNAFTTLFLTRQNPVAGFIACNIPIHAGEVIGILGSRGGINTYTTGDYATTIAGFPVQLERLGMQFPLETTNPQQIWREFGPTTSISRIEFTYTSVSCPGAPRTPVTATLNPLPVATATPATQTICSGPMNSVALTSTEPGTTYTWTRDNTVNVTGMAANGSGTPVTGTLTNTTSSPQTVTFTVTPTSGAGCVGATMTFTVTVNPVATVNAVTNQSVCNNAPTTTVNFSSPTTGGTIVYNWVNNTPSIGLAAAGTGDIPSFTATNTGSAPVTATITVTPSYTNASVTCTGTPLSFTITVNPTGQVDQPASQVVCNNAGTAPVNFTTTVPGSVFDWVNNTPSIGLAASGTGNIASFTATNAGNAPVVATVTVTPTYAGSGGLIPELLYYKFDGTGTNVPNLASAPPAGTNTATLQGGLTQGGSAICNGTIIGTGNSASTDYLNTGWAPNLGTSSWTISFKSENITPSATLFYVFGDVNTSSFRCFTNGVAGANNWWLRGGGLNDVPLNGGATVAPHTNTFVYDNVANEVRAYLDGVLVNTVAQPPGGVNLTGAGPFKVNGFGSNVGSPLNGHYDEFKFFNRALSAAEVSGLSACATAGP
ncbi:MAG: PKD-like domain-containing protein, partial [Ferruginibacter sp.]